MTTYTIFKNGHTLLDGLVSDEIIYKLFHSIELKPGEKKELCRNHDYRHPVLVTEKKK